MRKEKQTTIKGLKLKVTQLGFEAGIDLLVLLYKSLGPAIGAFLVGVDQKEGRDVGDAKVTMEALSQAMAELAQKLNAHDLKHLVNTLAKTTRIEREPGKWPVLEPEVDLAGEYGLLLRWLGFALEVNYGSFFGEGAGLKGVVAGLKQAAV